MRKVRQDAFNRRWNLNIPALRIGKVIAVNRSSHSVDVAWIDGGGVAAKVVVAAHCASSVFGRVELIAPTTDTDDPARKTYPTNSGKTLNAPAEQGQTDASNRDIYALCLPLAGGMQKGIVALGFLFPPIGEMLFDAGPNSEFSDLLVDRHPSDFQITTDRNGVHSVQHPSGARMSIGDISALDNTDIRTTAVNLEGKDYQKLYKLRKNLKQKAAFIAADTAGSQVLLDGKGNADMLTKLGQHVQLNQDGTVEIADGIGNFVNLSPTGITVTSAAAVTVNALNAIVNVTAAVRVVAAVMVSVVAPIINLLSAVINLGGPGGHPVLTTEGTSTTTKAL